MPAECHQWRLHGSMTACDWGTIPTLIEVDRVEVRAMVDNVSDSLSSMPPFITLEWRVPAPLLPWLVPRAWNSARRAIVTL